VRCSFGLPFSRRSLHFQAAANKVWWREFLAVVPGKVMMCNSKRPQFMVHKLEWEDELFLGIRSDLFGASVVTKAPMLGRDRLTCKQ